MEENGVKYNPSDVKLEPKDPERTTDEEMETDDDYDYEYEGKFEPSNFLEIGLTVKSEPEDENFLHVDVTRELEDCDSNEFNEELFLNPKAVYLDFEVSDSEYFFGPYLIKPCYVNLHNGIDSIDLRNCDICKKLKETSKNRTKYQCDICLQKFSNKLGIRLHIWHHLNPQSIIIDKAKKKNKKVIEEIDIVDCSYCCEKFESDEDLQNHMKVHRTVKSFQCTWCMEKFRSRHYLNKHECKVKKSLYECSTCKRIFFTKVELAEHKAGHTYSMFDCDICGKYFYYKSDLTRHSVVHDESRQFQCSFCPKQYSTKNYLEEHEKNHMGIKRYNCEICDKNYFWESQYKKHLEGSRHKKMIATALNVHIEDD